MQYRTNIKNGDKLSALGFGCMRFHKDEKEVEKQVRYAIEQGVNYFDTAYAYSGSQSHCPQTIPIPEKLEQVKQELESFPYKPMRFFAKIVLNYK